jgi:lipopolysaccharide/colanic/teichoic acid biosynthesis glycosyltransferase
MIRTPDSPAASSRPTRARRWTSGPFKRSVDIFIAFSSLLVFFPLIAAFCFLIWLHDRHSPLYIAARTGRAGKPFFMVKLRSMIVNQSTVDSTSVDDPRITPVGHVVRRYKIDELGQLWNVLKGDMSLVGPRPNVPRETALYTTEEKKLLDVRPGLTDLASIVFADEGEILAGKSDPDLSYHQLIRPWKSRLGLFYIDHASLSLDFRILFLTALALVSRQRALEGVARILERHGAPPELVRVARRTEPLQPHPPPGSDAIVMSRACSPQDQSGLVAS